MTQTGPIIGLKIEISAGKKKLSHHFKVKVHGELNGDGLEAH